MSLIYYGSSPVSNEFPLTMGDANNKYQTEVIVTVVDTLGSFSNMSIFVKVSYAERAIKTIIIKILSTLSLKVNVYKRWPH